MTPLEQARYTHEQAKRHLRRMEEEAKHRYPIWRVMERCNAKERVSRTLARVQELEATQPDGAGSRSHQTSDTQA